MAALVADLQKRMERTEVGSSLATTMKCLTMTTAVIIMYYMPIYLHECLSTYVFFICLQPVTVNKDITDQSTVTNKVATFECDIKINFPEITLSWYKGTQKLDNNDKCEISIVGDRHILKIKQCQTKDQGNYRVVCGPHISSAKLTVIGGYPRICICLFCTYINVIDLSLYTVFILIAMHFCYLFLYRA